MINVTLNAEIYPIKNKLSEYTIGEFEKICKILNNTDNSNIDNWAKVFVILGLPSTVVDECDIESFLALIKNISLTDDISNEIVKEITVEDKIYIAYDDKFKLTVKETGLIESYIKKNNEVYLADMLAVIYKNPEIDKSLHYDKSHLNYKAELFRKHLTSDIAIPFINILAKKIINDISLIQEING